MAFLLDGAFDVSDFPIANEADDQMLFMKKLVSQASVLVISGALFSIAVPSILAAEPDSATSTNRPPKAAVTSAPDSAQSTQTTTATEAKLPSTVADVVKLSRAKVSEDVIMSYVQNSGSTSGLSADDIVQMRKEGVSDRVINAMLDQHSRAMEIVQRAAAQAPASAESTGDAASEPAAEATSSPAQPAVVEAPLTPSSASSVYVIPYPAATSAYYGYYSPYYYPDYYGGPVFSFGFGYGGCYYGRGYYGGHGIYGYGGGGHGGHGGHR